MKKYIIIGIIIIIAILFLYNKQENATTTDSGKTLSDEALQNIASVYNNQNMQVTNLHATGIITGNVNGGITDSTGRYRLSIDGNGNLIMYDTSVNPWKLMPIESSNGFKGNVTGNLKGDVNGGITDSTEKCRLNIDAFGILHMYDTSGNPWKLMPIGSASNFFGLFNGQLISYDNLRSLIPQNDGNLVLYYTAGKPSSSMAGYVPTWAIE